MAAAVTAVQRGDINQHLKKLKQLKIKFQTLIGSFLFTAANPTSTNAWGKFQNACFNNIGLIIHKESVLGKLQALLTEKRAEILLKDKSIETPNTAAHLLDSLVYLQTAPLV